MSKQRQSFTVRKSPRIRSISGRSDVSSAASTELEAGVSGKETADLAKVYRMKGESKLQKGDWVDAAKYLEAAVRLGKDSTGNGDEQAKALGLLGDALLTGGKVKESGAYYLEALSQDIVGVSTKLFCLNNLAFYHYSLGATFKPKSLMWTENMLKCRYYYVEYLKTAPIESQLSCLVNLGCLLVNMERHHEAVETFEKALCVQEETKQQRPAEASIRSQLRSARRRDTHHKAVKAAMRIQNCFRKWRRLRHHRVIAKTGRGYLSRLWFASVLHRAMQPPPPSPEADLDNDQIAAIRDTTPPPDHLHYSNVPSTPEEEPAAADRSLRMLADVCRTPSLEKVIQSAEPQTAKKRPSLSILASTGDTEALDKVIESANPQEDRIDGSPEPEATPSGTPVHRTSFPSLDLMAAIGETLWLEGVLWDAYMVVESTDDDLLEMAEQSCPTGDGEQEAKSRCPSLRILASTGDTEGLDKVIASAEDADDGEAGECDVAKEHAIDTPSPSPSGSTDGLYNTSGEICNTDSQLLCTDEPEFPYLHVLASMGGVQTLERAIEWLEAGEGEATPEAQPDTAACPSLRLLASMGTTEGLDKVLESAEFEGQVDDVPEPRSRSPSLCLLASMADAGALAKVIESAEAHDALPPSPPVPEELDEHSEEPTHRPRCPSLGILACGGDTEGLGKVIESAEAHDALPPATPVPEDELDEHSEEPTHRTRCPSLGILACGGETEGLGKVIKSAEAEDAPAEVEEGTAQRSRSPSLGILAGSCGGAEGLDVVIASGEEDDLDILACGGDTEGLEKVIESAEAHDALPPSTPVLEDELDEQPAHRPRCPSLGILACGGDTEGLGKVIESAEAEDGAEGLIEDDLGLCPSLSLLASRRDMLGLDKVIESAAAENRCSEWVPSLWLLACAVTGKARGLEMVIRSAEVPCSEYDWRKSVSEHPELELFETSAPICGGSYVTVKVYKGMETFGAPDRQWELVMQKVYTPEAHPEWCLGRTLHSTTVITSSRECGDPSSPVTPLHMVDTVWAALLHNAGMPGDMIDELLECDFMNQLCKPNAESNLAVLYRAGQYDWLEMMLEKVHETRPDLKIEVMCSFTDPPGALKSALRHPKLGYPKQIRTYSSDLTADTTPLWYSGKPRWRTQVRKSVAVCSRVDGDTGDVTVSDVTVPDLLNHTKLTLATPVLETGISVNFGEVQTVDGTVDSEGEGDDDLDNQEVSWLDALYHAGMNADIANFLSEAEASCEGRDEDLSIIDMLLQAGMRPEYGGVLNMSKKMEQFRHEMTEEPSTPLDESQPMTPEWCRHSRLKYASHLEAMKITAPPGSPFCYDTANTSLVDLRAELETISWTAAESILGRVGRGYMVRRTVCKTLRDTKASVISRAFRVHKSQETTKNLRDKRKIANSNLVRDDSVKLIQGMVRGWRARRAAAGKRWVRTSLNEFRISGDDALEEHSSILVALLSAFASGVFYVQRVEHAKELRRLKQAYLIGLEEGNRREVIARGEDIELDYILEEARDGLKTVLKDHARGLETRRLARRMEERERRREIVRVEWAWGNRKRFEEVRGAARELAGRVEKVRGFERERVRHEVYGKICLEMRLKPVESLSCALVQCERDRVLDVSTLCLPPMHLSALFRVLPSLTITSLNLSSSALTNPDTALLCEHLHLHQYLTTLILSHNPALTTPSGKALLTLVSSNPRITHVDTDGTNIPRSLRSRITDRAKCNKYGPVVTSCAGSMGSLTATPMYPHVV